MHACIAYMIVCIQLALMYGCMHADMHSGILPCIHVWIDTCMDAYVDTWVRA